MSFFNELKRRNVFRVGVAYALGAWVLLQIVDFVLEVIAAPDWILQVFFLAAAVGLPVVLIFSWVFEMTPEGIKRESEIDRTQSITPQTRRKLDRVIIATLALAVLILLADKFLVGAGRDSETISPPAEQQSAAVSETPAETSPIPPIAARSVAVLPFIAMSNGPDDEYFADGLTEEILNSLAQLPELLVTARTSAFHFKGQDIPVQEIARQLGVRHIVEGSVRRSGDRLRATAQLIRAEDGFHLWSENYDSTSQDTIAVQEDIAEKIVLAMDVVMDEQKRDTMRQAGLRDIEAFIAFQKGREWYEKAHSELDQIGLLRRTNEYLETVLQRVPGFPPALQMHSDLYIHILLNDATDQPMIGVTEQEQDEAYDRATADYSEAIAHARSVEERDSLELDLAFLTGDWRGLPARLDRVLEAQGCDGGNWLEPLATVFGYAEKMLIRAHQLRLCDPLYSTAWVSEARVMMWTGDPAGAMAIATRGAEIAPAEWLSMVLINTLVAGGQFDQAEKEVKARIQQSTDILVENMMIAAARGDQARLAKLFEQYQASPEASGFFNMIFYALMGNREDANRLAAEVDQHPFSTVGLTMVAYWCYCGAPWDLEVTPNFAARIEEAGLPWPPAAPINFPLKDW